jgi:hypothetical protein
MSRRHPKSEAEKTAEQLANIVKDSTLDLDQVGIYLSRIRPSYLYKRLLIIVEAAEAESENEIDRISHNPLF